MTHHLYDLLAQLAASGNSYYEFIREDSMSVGLYQLRAGSEDPQLPHAQDEVYYVISGNAKFTLNDETHSVQPGSILYVAACAEHRFSEIQADLTALVFFAPPETSD